TIGTRQYLILVAGYDTFALRQPDWAHRLSIIELDRPGTQRDKLDRIARAGLSLPGNAALLPADLADPDWADQLRACPSFSPKVKTLCSLLGLIYYLAEDEFSALLESLSTLLPPGSALAFDYPAPQGDGAQSQLAASAGEPMKAVYPYARMERLLADHGFRIYEHLDEAGLEERFFARHNLLEHSQPIHPLPGVCCCLAVHR
ncbi:MAG: class I SAM-dependent methyltransferase, partial [Candidatus Spyradocola sp.]